MAAANLCRVAALSAVLQQTGNTSECPFRINIEAFVLDL